MIPHQLVGTAQVPGGDGELRCFHHDGDYKIFVDSTELMSTRVFGSEQALAELALQRLARPAGRVLVAGLGMGFTLARVLELVDATTRVDVAEIVPEVVAWNRELFGHHTGHPLRDPRTHALVTDVGEVLRASPTIYDVVLLDVDNGPEALSRAGNDALYDERGLATAGRALRPGGVLAIWSSSDHRDFEHRLRRGGFTAERHRVRARRTKGPWRTIWVASLAHGERRRT